MIYWLAQTDSYIHINQHIGIPKWYFTLFTNIGTSLVKTQGCSCCLLSFCHPRRLLFTSWSCSLLVCSMSYERLPKGYVLILLLILLVYKMSTLMTHAGYVQYKITLPETKHCCSYHEKPLLLQWWTLLLSYIWSESGPVRLYFISFYIILVRI